MSESSTNAQSLHCLVVTPEATVLDARAEFVTVPLFDGECGIAPKHGPLIGRLGYGELRIKSGGEERRYFVDGGFVQVADDVVSVLTNRAIAAERLDSALADENLRSALAHPAAGDEAIALRERLILQARGQQRVARRAK